MLSHFQKHIFFCTNVKDLGKKCCSQQGGESFATHAKSRLQALDLHGPNKVRVSRSGCLGRCSLGPCVVIYPEGVWYTYETFDDIDEIINQHIVLGQKVCRLLIEPMAIEEKT